MGKPWIQIPSITEREGGRGRKEEGKGERRRGRGRERDRQRQTLRDGTFRDVEG